MLRRATSRRYHPHLTRVVFYFAVLRGRPPRRMWWQRLSARNWPVPGQVQPVIGLLSFFFLAQVLCSPKGQNACRVCSAFSVDSPSVGRVFCSPRRIASSRLRPRHFRRFALGTCRTSASAPRWTARPRARERPSAEAAVVPCQLTSV